MFEAHDFDFDSPVPAGISVALETADTVELVGAFIELQLHGTAPVALVASHAIFLDEFHPNDTDLVEEGVEGPQRADGSAEGTPGKDHEDRNDDEDGELVVEKDADEFSQARIQKQHGDACLEGSGRAHILAEPGAPITEGVQNREGQQDDEKDKKEIFPVIQEFGQPYLG